MAGNGSSNDLSWTASNSRDVSGYNVESAPTSDGPWTAITGEPITATGFSDATPAPDGPTFYRVMASVGGELSAPAGPVSVTRSAPAAMEAPAGVEAPLLTPRNESVIVEPELESVLFFGSEMSIGGNGGLLFGVQESSEAGAAGTAGVAGDAGQIPADDPSAADADVGGEASDSISEGLVIGSDPTSDDQTVSASERVETATSGGEILWIALVMAVALSVISVTRWRLSRRNRLTR